MTSNKRIAISQSNYIPWKGYFDYINSVDEFVLFDDMQYTRRDWRNRNRIKTPQGLKWLTVPVQVKGNYHAAIREIEVSDPQWGVSHWKSLRANYARSPHFGDFAEELEAFYLNPPSTSLSQINRVLLELVMGWLGIPSQLSWSMDYQLVDGKSERLVEICKQAGAVTYVTGPAARDYMDEMLFQEAGITVEWMDYSGYPEYPQLNPPFEHGVTVLDLLFNMGPESRTYMKSLAGS